MTIRDVSLREKNQLLVNRTIRELVSAVTALQATDADLSEIAALSNVAGDILYTDATPEWNRLAKGSDGQVLTLASGLPSWADAGGGAWEYIGAVTASGGTVDFTGLSSSYVVYMFVFADVDPSADAALEVLTDGNNGASFDTGASDYGYTWAKSGSAHDGAAQNTASEIRLTDTVGGGAGEFVNGIVYCYAPSNSSHTMFSWFLTYNNTSGNQRHIHGGGKRFSTTAVDAVRFQMSSGNLAGGTIRLYGLVPS